MSEDNLETDMTPAERERADGLVNKVKKVENTPGMTDVQREAMAQSRQNTAVEIANAVKKYKSRPAETPPTEENQ